VGDALKIMQLTEKWKEDWEETVDKDTVKADKVKEKLASCLRV